MEEQEQTLPWIRERDEHEPEEPDTDFITLLMENEFH